LMYIYVI